MKLPLALLSESEFKRLWDGHIKYMSELMFIPLLQEIEQKKWAWERYSKLPAHFFKDSLVEVERDMTIHFSNKNKESEK